MRGDMGGLLGRCKVHVKANPLEALWGPAAEENGRLSRAGLLTVGPQTVSVPPALDPYMVKARERSLLCKGGEGVYRATEARGQALDKGIRKAGGSMACWGDVDGASNRRPGGVFQTGGMGCRDGM